MLVALAVLLTSCSDDRDVVTVTPSPSEAATAHRQGSRAICDRDIPFEVTYLPEGFSDEMKLGPAPRSRRPDGRGQVIWHLRSEDASYIEVRRPGTLFAELALGDQAPTIEVLGAETPNFGPITPGGDHFIVQFVYPPRGSRENDCAIYSLNEYGVSLEELRKVAEGLRPIR